MSLALVRQRYTPFGGAERFLERAMAALQQERGLQITLIARRWSGDLSGWQMLPCDRWHIGRWWRDRTFARCVQRRLQEQRFDLVQSHERLPGCDLYRAGDGVHQVWLRERGRTDGWFGRLATALSPYHRQLLAMERQMMHSPQLRAVICNSRMVQREIQDCFAVAPEKLHVIYSGVDAERFHPQLAQRWRQEVRQQWSIAEKQIVLLLVGSGFERKGVPIALQALARLPQQFSLLVVGQDRALSAMQRQAERLGVAERLRLTGGQRNVEAFYGAADILLLPTRYDPFPNVALEGMAAALPLVTSHQCGACDLIRHGENGLLGDSLDLERLLANIRVLQDGAERQRMGMAARQTVLPLTLEAMSSRLLQLYRTLLQR
ncbi:MAG: glycosyltransferase family 4 protein [Magnetococcales bacterium]|nr:glycosyltransferase family 4 protein [Magnetococcales bacterium]MBF0113875.1 glycosyltransferase family 4 protein [Magnetococcales bacterium]